jgi:pyridine nucleotide-disulfide oxidoreductase family protein
MLPGFIAGHYTREQCHIDLRPLTRLAGARLIHDEAIGLDVTRRLVSCRTQPSVGYDLLSIDIGSTPHLSSTPGAAQYATPVKPIDGLAARWEEIVDRIRQSEGATRFLTVGGGAAGVELTLAMRYRLRGLLRELGRDPNDVSFALVTDGQILATHNQRVRDMFRDHLQARGVQLIEHSAAREVQRGTVVCVDGTKLGFDELIWVTQAGAASWLADSGLEVDEGGFIKINAALQAISDPRVFAAGDVASSVQHPRPKAGVFAVRQGPPLADNLRRAVAGEQPAPFMPQTKFLSLISTGDRYAVASRGQLAAQGALLWHLKDWIDRRWMRPVPGPSQSASRHRGRLTRSWSDPEIHHARNKCAEAYPRDSGRPHTVCIPLHSRGRRTREASHGEGGLQADRGRRNPRKTGLRVPSGGASPRCPVSLSGTLMPKTLRGAVRSRSIIKLGCGFSSPRSPWIEANPRAKTLRGEGALFFFNGTAVPFSPWGEGAPKGRMRGCSPQEQVAPHQLGRRGEGRSGA